jgi:hypothetical protein
MTFSNFAHAVQWAENRTTGEPFYIKDNTDFLMGIYEVVNRYNVCNRERYTISRFATENGFYFAIILPDA